MIESYRSIPEPCTSMKIVVQKDINIQKNKPNNTININYVFPVEFKEIKQEKVKKKKKQFPIFENLQGFTWESLWGNAGGYIGFFLGISLMQLPQIIMDMLRKFNINH